MELKTDQTNFLARNRATLDIQAIPDMRFYCQQFQLPDMNLPDVFQGTPFSVMKFAGDHIQYGYLDISFLVHEDLSNWIQIHDWVRGLGFPEQYPEYANREHTYSDATLVVYSNKQNPIKEFRLIEIFPVRLGTIEFDQTDDQYHHITASATFAVQRYDIVR